jgi:hypothetical protein
MSGSARFRFVDFNALLQLANACTIGLLLYVYFRFDSLPPNEYMDANTAALGLLLAAQTHAALWIERRRRDPFVLLLALWMILYYQLRLFTLAALPFSIVFDRLSYDVADSNFALMFILGANLFIYAGLSVVRFRGNLRVDIGDLQAKTPIGVAVLLLATIVFAYLRGAFWTADNVPRALNFVIGFFMPELVILMALVYLLLFHRSISRPFVWTIGGLIALEMLAHTLWGSRSAVMGLAQATLVAALAALGTIQVRARTVALGAVLLPALLGVLIALFSIATYNRVAREGAASLDVGQALTFAGEAREVLGDDPIVDVLLPPIAARAGYFDFSAEVIANQEEYSAVINFPTYLRSLIDNLLTPGFDVFDQPMTANALRFIYYDQGQPSRAMADAFYHSDQICVYGEFYVLFGFAALPLLFLGAMAWKSFYVQLRHPNPFILGAARAVTLLVFVRVLDSFGTDWTITTMVPYLAALFLFSYLFTVRRAPALLPDARAADTTPAV